jgi:hypothetical protein
MNPPEGTAASAPTLGATESSNELQNLAHQVEDWFHPATYFRTGTGRRYVLLKSIERREGIITLTIALPDRAFDAEIFTIVETGLDLVAAADIGRAMMRCSRDELVAIMQEVVD